MDNRIIKAFEESAEVKVRFAKENEERIRKAANLIVSACKNGGKVMLFGNGGSAGDASHIAGEFVNRFLKDRAPLPAIALNTDMAVLTSIGNDYDFSDIFVRQIKALGKEGDIAIAISTSGNSNNVLKGVMTAKEMNIKTIGLTGGTGGKLAGIVDYAFVVPTNKTPRIQETHITLGHILCELIEEEIFGK